MRKLLFIDKKGLSEMVSYVLLIVIAVALSVLVYAYLEVFVPKDKATCDEGISLVVQEATCTFANKELNVTIFNKGLFTTEAVYIRIAEENKKVKSLVNSNNVFFASVIGEALEPGATFRKNYTIPSTVTVQRGGVLTLEIQPAVGTPSKFALCDKAIVTQKITCT